MPTSVQALPRHIAIIPDGNRRWAKRHHRPTLEGHRRGVEVFEKVAYAAIDRGVQYLTFWGFSTENWRRSKREVAYLLRLFRWVFTTKIDQLNRENIKLNIIGRLSGFSQDLQTLIRKAVSLTENNTRGVMTIALNYGGRAEILDAVKRALRQNLTPQQVTERRFSELMYAPSVPDPDLIIRTSGEHRMSGFFAWPGTFSELYFSDKAWPDFSERDLDAALHDYAKRQRRFGA